ncbi:MAG: hypothetical protein J6O50_11125 [Ruminiclostridium sp.]|nr:hypothetical protein [Ruminiclostridium sp.]
MGKLTALVSIAALAGVGFYVGKKLIEKRNAEEEERAQHVYEDDSDVFVEERHSTPKEKIQRASLFAVGAIKTGTEKFKEGIDDIINKDMITKGEETVAKGKETAAEAKDKAVNFAKTTGENIKTGIDNIKSKVAGKAEEIADETGAADLAEAIEKDVDELTEKAVDMAEEIKNSPEPIVEQAAEAVEEIKEEVKDELKDASDDINSVSIDSVASEAVETFDFSNPEQL